jgi:DNA-binding MarR family transcriptional regulator
VPRGSVMRRRPPLGVHLLPLARRLGRKKMRRKTCKLTLQDSRSEDYHSPMAKRIPPASQVDLAAADLLEACNQLVRRLRAESNNLELTWSQIFVLARLETGPMSIAELARAEAVKPQSMGVTLAVLEDEGLVQRTPHPTDGRQYLFALTPDGVEARRRTREAKHAWLMGAVAKLSAAEQKSLLAAAAVISRLAETTTRDP